MRIEENGSNFPKPINMNEALKKPRTAKTAAKHPAVKAGEHLVRMAGNAFRSMADAKEKGARVNGRRCSRILISHAQSCPATPTLA